jgi:long-chain acyl-CoA synthetase
VSTRLLEIEGQLTAAGAPFELTDGEVLGEQLKVFARRAGSLRELLAESAAQGDAEYLVYGSERISFAEHLARVGSVARALEERFAVRKGDRVAILAANRPEWVVTFWAAVSLGAIPVGLNGWWAGDEIRYAVGDCEPKVLVGDAARLARLDGAAPGVPVVEMEAGFGALCSHAPGAPLASAPISEDDPACILYTSGTTGHPKGAVNTHRGVLGLVQLSLFNGARNMMAALAAGAASAPGPRARPCSLVTTPFFHVSGLYTGAVMMLATGSKIVLRSGRFDPVDVMRLIERERVTAWGPMGTMAYRVVYHPQAGEFDLSSVTNIGSGGSPMAEALQQKLRETFPSASGSLGLGYGLTECTALATVCSGEDLIAHPDSVGRPLPTVEVEIRNTEGKALPEGKEGEIHIRSPLVMLEYWRRPDATAESILPGRWLRTGDVGRLQEGRLYVNSRARDLILRGGENVYPVEIEQRIESHPAVLEAAVAGIAHEELGQEVKAFVVPQRGEHPSPRALSAWVGKTLAGFKIPSQWEIRTEPLPRNATGKVLKHVLLGEAENPFLE